MTEQCYQSFDEIDRIMSEQIMIEVGAQKNMCHFNSWKASLLHPELKYFRGFVVFGEDAYVHSWLMNGDVIIDPTLILHDESFGEEYIGIEVQS